MDESSDLLPLTDESALTSVPETPVPKPSELGWFVYLVVPSRHPSVGWEQRPETKGGRCFLVGRETLASTIKVLQRFPFTEEGWGQAWRYLLATDQTLVGQLSVKLAGRVPGDRNRVAVAALRQQAIASVRSVTLLGGYAPEVELPTGRQYDLLFLSERLLVVRAAEAEALVDLAYSAVEGIEIGGAGLVRKFSFGQQLVLTEMLGLLGEVIAVSSTKIETVIRLNGSPGELFFLCTSTLPDALRIALSRPLAAIQQARAARAPSVAAPPSAASAKVAELSRLASLLDAGLLTRAEFEQLKAELLTNSGDGQPTS